MVQKPSRVCRDACGLVSARIAPIIRLALVAIAVTSPTENESQRHYREGETESPLLELLRRRKAFIPDAFLRVPCFNVTAIADRATEPVVGVLKIKQSDGEQWNA